ncbi:MAG TPA: carboxypeptidase-like regulatory domain-containing protein [Pyrinomonadaceae bacterium]|nr:carboxypeptidase-like regulatory domain-containing protein [Pyrinomonadaceae bacterium]
MIGKYFFGALAVAILLVFASISAVAQVGELRGTVMLKQADGQKVPLADAQIDVFRTDIKGEYKTKTNKKGEFVFAGIPFVGTYVVAASHPTASPNFMPGVKAGKGIPVDIEVNPGDGKRLTYDEIKNAGGASAAPAAGSGSSGNSGGGRESDADKAKREELERKNKEIMEGNKKIEEANATIARTFKAGNEALTAATTASRGKQSEVAIQKFGEAITQYDEGLTADAEQPAILTNKAVALKGRGVEKYNAMIQNKGLDDAGKTAGLESAKADFKAAAEASNKAVTLIKAQPVPTDPADLQRYNGNKYAALLTQSESMRLYVSKVDGTKADAGVTAFKDYIAIETDPVKKGKAQLDLAQMLMDSGAADKAFIEYQAILESQPDNPDANLGAGLALYAANEKAKFQDAANFLQKFVDKAPDGHPFKDDAKAILAEMKASQNITPEKSKPAPKRRP